MSPVSNGSTDLAMTLLYRNRRRPSFPHKTLVTLRGVVYSETPLLLVEFRGLRFVDSKPAPQNIQDGFLNLARRGKTTVTIYLVNGAKLLGRIKSFDKFSLIMETGAQEP